jgi:ubiquinone biosynthesis protein
MHGSSSSTCTPQLRTDELLAFLGAAFGVISVMLIGVRGGPLLVPTAAGTGGTSLFHAFGYAGLFFSLVLILRVVIAITREGI